MELFAGSSGDTPGEDSAVVFIQLPSPDIEIVKYVRGMDDKWYDANTPAEGPYMDGGSAVAWKYVITNIGDEPLVNVIVTDDQGVSVPDPGTLDVGETVTYIVNDAVPSICVPYGNTGSVEGTGLASGFEVTDSDPAYYNCVVYEPAIKIVKYVQGMDDKWYDANTHAEGPYMDGGSAVSWKYVITNTGDEPLRNVTVTDNKGVSVPDPGNLGIGETVTYIVDGKVSDPCSSYTNVGKVVGIGEKSGKSVTDSDPAYYNCVVYEPAIKIVKYVQGMDDKWYDANTHAEGPYMDGGSAVSWKYVITNTGDEPLRNVTVTDNKGVSVPDPGNLGIGETVTYIVDGQVSDPCSSYTNVGKVVGIGEKSGKSVT
ncbi:MAG: hypothetical protein M8350_09295, partial [Methanosarcinaceae archaeon]|nr:hypothetical protein [Methanosarcinaceae archaeon]